MSGNALKRSIVSSSLDHRARSSVIGVGHCEIRCADDRQDTGALAPVPSGLGSLSRGMRLSVCGTSSATWVTTCSDTHRHRVGEQGHASACIYFTIGRCLRCCSASDNFLVRAHVKTVLIFDCARMEPL